jgi:hypothetical protein
MGSKFRYSSYDPSVTAEMADRQSLDALPQIEKFVATEDARKERVYGDKYKFYGGGYPKRLEQHPKWRNKTLKTAMDDPIYNSETAIREARNEYMPKEHVFAERTGGAFIGNDTWMTRTAILQQEKRRQLSNLRRTVSESDFSFDKTMARCLEAANDSQYEFWPRYSKYHYWGGRNGTGVGNRFLAGSQEEKDFLRVARGYDESMLGMYRHQF